MTDDHIYRAHRFGIIMLESGDFALYTPEGEYIAAGVIESLAQYVTTGEEQYELCVERWASRQRYTKESGTSSLLAKLGLAKPQVKIERRI